MSHATSQAQSVKPSSKVGHAEPFPNLRATKQANCPISLKPFFPGIIRIGIDSPAFMNVMLTVRAIFLQDRRSIREMAKWGKLNRIGGLMGREDIQKRTRVGVQ